MTNKEKYKIAMDHVKASNQLKNKAMQRIKNKNSRKLIKLIPKCAIAFLLVVSIVWITNENKNVPIQYENSMEIAKKIDLPTIGNSQNLKRILKVYTMQHTNILESNKSADLEDSATNESYSRTNNQVENVEEGDIVTTDGKFIYRLDEKEITIVDVQNPEQMKNVATISLEDSNNEELYLSEMYIKDNKLIVIAEKNAIYTEIVDTDGNTSKTLNNCQNSTLIIIYNVEDKNNIKKEREVEVDGIYISSRLVDNNFYLIASQRVFYNNTKNLEECRPSYKDSTISGDKIYKSYNDIYYFPENISNCYSNVVSLDIFKNEQAQVYSFLGTGEKIYMNSENIYITHAKYGNIENVKNEKANMNEQCTEIYKIKLNNQELQYGGIATVKGTIINQFAMDDSNGYFKIATTSWLDEKERSNNLYIFDKELHQVGQLENLAEGESIYSVRFMQNRVYLVTYKTMDPLFVIDLTEPTEPKVLGELKIQGVSQYLHPYDENHLIGIGKNTIEKNGNAIEKGMKISLFDVTDVTNPVEQYSVNIGESGTFSEILYNHKVFCYYKDKNIVAIPISIREKGKYTFDGAIFYQIDLENGIIEKGRIADNRRKDYKNRIDRIIFIEDNFYTISRSTINAVNSDNLNKISSISK